MRPMPSASRTTSILSSCTVGLPFSSSTRKRRPTPQQIAVADVVRGVEMFRNENVNIPVAGIVENMAWFTPAELPENKYYLFGKEGVKRLAEEMQVPLLGQIPIVQSICESGDEGEPAAVKDDTMTALAFRNLAEAVVAET